MKMTTKNKDLSDKEDDCDDNDDGDGENNRGDERDGDDGGVSGQYVWVGSGCNWKQSSKQFVFPIECFSIALDDDNDNDDGTDANVIVR